MNDVRTLLQAAANYLRGGLPVIPCEGKTPCDDRGFPVKDWHSLPATVDRLDAGLRAAKSPAVGLKLGPDSCLDIEADGPEEEALFEQLFEGCDVPRTPSFRSPRGLHRLFAWDNRLATTEAGVVHYRGANGAKLGVRIGANGKAVHSVIPPSPGREWLPCHSLLECEPAQLPDLIIGRIIAAKKPPLSEWYSHHSQADVGHSNVSSIPVIETQQGHSKGSFSIAMCPTVEDAIAATIPSGPGFRNGQIFVFARYLKGMPQYGNSEVGALKPVLVEWHRRALPFIGTKDFGETWRDFVVAWGRVKSPISHGPLALIVQAALSKPAPQAADRYDTPDLRALVAVCAELQRIHGEEPIFLTCRDAAQYVGGNRAAFRIWNRHLNRLVADKVLRLHQQGGWMKRDGTSVGKSHRASEYFYLGDMP